MGWHGGDVCAEACYDLVVDSLSLKVLQTLPTAFMFVVIGKLPAGCVSCSLHATQHGCMSVIWRIWRRRSLDEWLCYVFITLPGLSGTTTLRSMCEFSLCAELNWMAIQWRGYSWRHTARMVWFRSLHPPAACVIVPVGPGVSAAYPEALDSVNAGQASGDSLILSAC